MYSPFGCHLTARPQASQTPPPGSLATTSTPWQTTAPAPGHAARPGRARPSAWTSPSSATAWPWPPPRPARPSSCHHASPTTTHRTPPRYYAACSAQHQAAGSTRAFKPASTAAPPAQGLASTDRLAWLRSVQAWPQPGCTVLELCAMPEAPRPPRPAPKSLGQPPHPPPRKQYSCAFKGRHIHFQTAQMYIFKPNTVSDAAKCIFRTTANRPSWQNVYFRD